MNVESFWKIVYDCSDEEDIKQADWYVSAATISDAIKLFEKDFKDDSLINSITWIDLIHYDS